MAITTQCADVEIRYKGNGSLKQFSFPFTYLEQEHIHVSLWDDSTKEYVDVAKTDWSFANPTTIEFKTAPAAPPTHLPTDPIPEVFNIRIYRKTNLDAMEASFYPGSAIRAEDLNDDFDQLRLAIQETKCLAYGSVTELSTTAWSKYSIANTGDTVTKKDQRLGNWPAAGNDQYVATTDAISARLDPYVQDTLPAPIAAPEQEQPGKLWLDDDDIVSRYWDPTARAWVTLANTGPKGEKGEKGDRGEPGGIVFKGDLDVTAPPPAGVLAGWQYVNSTTGTAHVGFNGLSGTINKGNVLLYSGTDWIFQQDALPGVTDATEGTRGIVELASPGETEAGTDATRAVHPAGLKPLLDKKLDVTTAAGTYQDKAGMSSYLTTAAASSTYLSQAAAATAYQTQTGMSSYLLAADATATYQTKAAMSGYLPKDITLLPELP